MGDDSEWMKLSTEDKVQHKLWKARSAGYEECVKLFNASDDDKNPEFSKYLGLMKKFVTDNNAIAQEKALDATLAYVENAAVAGKTASEVIGGIITKCLNASRAKTKEKGLEIILMYVEIEKQEIVQDELIKGLGNKQPKVVVGCVQALRMALAGFGNKVIFIKPMVKHIQPLLEHRDKLVREEGKLLVIEMYRWINVALKPHLANLKPVQITELEAEFENIPAGKPIQERFLRSQQDLKEKLEAQAEEAGAGGDAAAVGGDEEEEDLDPYDLMEAVDILSKIPSNFYDQIEAKKWQDRKEALGVIEKLVANPKIQHGDFHDLVRVLKKVVAKDSNVMLVTLAAKCLCGLAIGLRKGFSQHAPGAIDTMLEKFKEKKAAVVAQLREACDACFKCTSLEPISESIVTCLNHKTPSVRSETASFLARCFTHCTIKTLPKKLLKVFAAPLLKTINDTAPEVREASFIALGTAKKVVGEKGIMPLIADIDAIKLAKINENAEKAVVVGKGASSAAGGGGAAPASKPAAAAPSTAAAASKAKGTVNKPKSVTGGKPKAAGKPSAAAGKAKGGKKDSKGKGAASASNEFTEQPMSDEVAEDKATELLTAETVASMANSNYKERLAALERFTEVVKGMAKPDIPCQAFVKTIAKKPGVKDNNFQVLKLRIELLSYLAKNSNFSRTSAEIVLTDLVDKVGDIKNGMNVRECFSCMSEACSMEFISQVVVKAAFAQKNPKNQAESLNWLADAIKEFGFKVNIKPMVANIKKALAATNPAVRTSAINLLGVCYMYMGATLRILFEDEKPALLQLIDAEFEKVKGQKPPAPSRGIAPAGDEADDDDDDDEGKEEDGFNVADLVPRNDISAQITPELLEKMASANWKERQEGLGQVVAILNEAKFITANISGLPEALKVRLGDSNKILQKTTLEICTTLAQALGPHSKQHVRVVGPGILGCFADSKPMQRQFAVTCLDAWVAQCGVVPFIEAEMFYDALKLENPFLRAELFGWLAAKLPDLKKLPIELNQCVPILLNCLEDRNPEVRKKSQEALMPFMIHVGYDSMLRAAGKLKPSSKTQVQGLLEKARGNLPAKPVKEKKVTKTARAPSPEPTPFDEEDEPVVAPADKKPAAGAAKKKRIGLSKKAPPPTSKKKQVEEDVGPIMKVSNGKEQRFKDEKNLKVLKWNFAAPRTEFLDQLRSQMEPTFSSAFITLLFHSDFKNHIKAIQQLTDVVDSMSEEIMANLDLILKWLTLRFFDTNTSVLLKSLELQQKMFNMLSESDYQMQELEGQAFVPYLINKVGDPKDAVRRDIRNIFRLICKVYPSSKMFLLISDGLKSKNSKQRTECLEALGELIDGHGIGICEPSPGVALKTIAGQISYRDNSVRSAALNTIVTAYSILGDNVYKHVGKLNDKDMDMLDERIKRASKNKPAGARVVVPEEPAQSTKVVRTRPNTAAEGKPPPSSSSANRPQSAPAKKMFALNVDDDEDQDVAMPELIPTDMDEFQEPIAMPKIRSRPQSPSVKMLRGCRDAKSAIDLVISQISSTDIQTSIQAMAQIDEVLKNENKSQMLTNHVDQLIEVCSLQSRVVYSKHMGDENTPRADVIKLYQCLLAVILALLDINDLITQASRDVLKDLIYNLITILLDARLNDLEDGPQVVRSVNVTLVRMVSKADHTNTLCALIKLLTESVAADTHSAKFQELIMKCLWKMIRLLPNIINDINLDRVMLELHLFLQSFRANNWQAKPNDTPLRTIKTIVYTLVTLKKQKVFNHLALIDNRDDSDLEAYINKVLQSSGRSSKSHDINKDNVNGDSVELKTPRQERVAHSVGSSKRLSKSTNDTLAEIFKKIGLKENTREGLNDLYDFKLKYPEADLEPFLKKSSQFFQTYIERGLNNIEKERRVIGTGPGSIGGSVNTGSLPNLEAGSRVGSGSVNMLNPQDYRDRLKNLRIQIGLDANNSNANQEEPLGRGLVHSKSSGEVQSEGLSSLENKELSQPFEEKVNSQEEERPANPTSQANLQDLKERLARIKNASKKENL